MGEQWPPLTLYIFQLVNVEELSDVRYHLNSVLLNSHKTFDKGQIKVLIIAYKSDSVQKVICQLYRGLHELIFLFEYNKVLNVYII